MDAPPSVLHFQQVGVEVDAHHHDSDKPTDKMDIRSRAYQVIDFNGKPIFRLGIQNLIKLSPLVM